MRIYSFLSEPVLVKKKYDPCVYCNQINDTQQQPSTTNILNAVYIKIKINDKRFMV